MKVRGQYQSSHLPVRKIQDQYHFYRCWIEGPGPVSVLAMIVLAERPPGCWTTTPDTGPLPPHATPARHTHLDLSPHSPTPHYITHWVPIIRPSPSVLPHVVAMDRGNAAAVSVPASFTRSSNLQISGGCPPRSYFLINMTAAFCPEKTAVSPISSAFGLD
ncbi:hypothetical protein J6590_017329, partial [Homalodisca vitripennis]